MIRRDCLLLLAALSACGPVETTADAPWPLVRHDELRPDSPGTTEPPPSYGATDVVERHDVPDASVVVHFTRAGTHRVPSADLDDSGVPDFVERVESTYSDVLAQYHGPWGFKPPPDDGLVPQDHGGDARFDVYLVDFNLRADGAFRKECLAGQGIHCPGYMVQENDFAGYGYPTVLAGIVTVSSHEYFHAVQAGYSSLQGVNVTEGTAVWATERFAPQLNDLEGFSGGYLSAPDRSLDQEPTTAVDNYAYGLGLFFECLSAQRGQDAVRDLWDRIDGGAGWLGTLERNVAEDGGSLQTVMERCAEWNVFTGARARAGYGHGRANRLALATVTDLAAPLTVARSRMFRASSRYWHVTSLPPDAVAWWSPAFDAPDGGAASMRVRLAADVAGAPTFVPLPRDVPVPVGGAPAVFVLLSNVSTSGASVPVGVCVGSPAFVDQCRFGDAGTDAGSEPEDAGVPDAGPTDAGMTLPEPPKGCGCSSGAGPLLLALAAWLRRRKGAVALAAALTVTASASAQEDVPDAGEEIVDAGEPEAVPEPEPDAGAPALAVVAEAPDAGPAAAAPLEAPSLTTVVTGGRLPQQLKDSTVAVEVITKRQIQESGARDVAEILQARPGLEVLQNVGTAGLRMGGLGPEYNLIMVDGQRVAGRINGGVDLRGISIENIEQIEIVKGPSSVLWGSEALAGTVNIITKTPTKPLGGSATVSYGTLNQVSATGAGEAAVGKWGVLVTGGYERRDAYDYEPAIPATNGSSLDQVQTALKATWGSRSQSEPSADVRVDYTRRVQHGVDEGGAGALFDRATRDNVLQARLGGKVPVGNGAVVMAGSASLFDRRFILDQRDSTVLDSVEDSKDVVGQVDAQVSQTFFATHTLLAGGQAIIEALDSPRLDSGEGRRYRGAVFVQDGWAPQLAVPLTIAAGVRADLDSFFGAALTPRLALRLDPTPAVALRASTGLGYRAPSFQELLLDFENPSVGYIINGNPALRPERSWGSNVSAQWAPGIFLFSLSLFWNELWDMIGFSETGNGELLRYQYKNLTRARSRGGELSASVTLFTVLSIEAGYTLTDTRDFSTGLPFEGQAVHRGFGQVRWRMREWGLTAQVRCSVTGPRPFLVDDTTVRWGTPFAMLDARVAKTLGSHVELFVAGMNLAGAGSASELPIPPRSVFGGISVKD